MRVVQSDMISIAIDRVGARVGPEPLRKEVRGQRAASRRARDEPCLEAESSLGELLDLSRCRAAVGVDLQGRVHLSCRHQPRFVDHYQRAFIHALLLRD